jgi:hypothetical protein
MSRLYPTGSHRSAHVLFTPLPAWIYITFDLEPLVNARLSVFAHSPQKSRQCVAVKIMGNKGQRFRTMNINGTGR